MKTILSASLLALVTNLAVAAPMTPGGTGYYSSTEPTLTSLGQFDQGDPDEVVNAGYHYSGGSHGSTGSTLTSLDQFEQGDPDEMVTGRYHDSRERHTPAGPAVTSLARLEKGDPDTTPGG